MDSLFVFEKPNPEMQSKNYKKNPPKPSQVDQIRIEIQTKQDSKRDQARF